MASCGFIKVNGKPLGGAATPGPSPATRAANEAPTGAPPGTPGQPPAWCKDAGFYTSSDVSLADFTDIKADDYNLDRSAGQFGTMMCTRGRVTDRDKIMALRASWMQDAGIDEKDFFVLVHHSNRLFFESQDPRSIPGPTSQISDAYPSQVMVELDRLGPRAAMLARYMAAEQCLPGTIRGAPLLMDILCTRDQLDPTRARAEIDKLGDALKPGTRLHLRRMVWKVTTQFTKKRAAVAAKAKDDPGIAKLVAIADEQFKQWAAPSPRRQKLEATLATMEAASKARKHSAFAGCEAATGAAWREHLATLTLPKVNAKNALETFIGATLDTAEGYLAYQALRLCAAGTSKDLRIGADPVSSDVIRRGPRTATIAAWMAHAGEIKFDDRGLDMETLLKSGELPLSLGRREPTFTGLIAELKDLEGGVEIQFKKVTDAVEDCLSWRETNRIEGFNNDGSIRYRSVCTKWGMVKVDRTPRPLRISKLLAKGLAKGMYLVAMDTLGIVATAGPKSSKPSWVLGGVTP